MIRRTIPALRMSLCLAAVLLALTGAIDAQELGPNYKYVEGGALWVNPDGFSSDTGWFVGATFGTKHFQAFGEYADPGDPASWFVGAGWHGLLGPKADLVAQGAY